MKLILAMLSVNAVLCGANSMAGNYVLQNTREVGSELLLKPDGTFEYMLAYGAADYMASGSYRQEGEFIILNSVRTNEQPFQSVRATKEKSPVLRIRVLSANGKPVPNIDVHLIPEGAHGSARTDESGIALFPGGHSAESSVVFRIPVYQFEAGPFALDPAASNVTFQINPDAITHVPFHDEALQIRGADLELRYWDKSTPKMYRKE